MDIDIEASLDVLKSNIREEKYPFFSNDELIRILEGCNYDIRRASYEALVKKAENDGVRLPSGLTVQGNREYWLALAKKYRHNMGCAVLRGDE